MVRRILSMAALVCLSGFVVGCAKQGPIYRDRPVEVLVPVAQVCASTRPAKVPALRDTLPGRNGTSGMCARRPRPSASKRSIGRPMASNWMQPLAPARCWRRNNGLGRPGRNSGA